MACQISMEAQVASAGLPVGTCCPLVAKAISTAAQHGRFLSVPGAQCQAFSWLGHKITGNHM